MALPIGGFMPIPLAMMIPFMATQSLVMGDAFGKAYQFGKRKISAMTNEEFNRLTLTDLISEMQSDFKLAIPKIQQSIQDSTELQSSIISEMLRILPKFVTSDANTELGKDISKTFGTQLTPEGGGFNLGGIKIVIEKMIENFSIPQAFGATTETSTFTPPEFGDQSPPPPPFDKEVNSAQNELEYRKRQADAEALARGRTLLEQTKTVHTSDALRRKSIADSGLSPLAFNARASFRNTIDKTAASLKSSIEKLRIAKSKHQNNASVKLAVAVNTGHVASATKQLSKLRIKYQQVYGEHY